MKMQRIVLCAVLGVSCLAHGSSPTWRMTVEKDGATNMVTATANPYAIDVDFGERDGAWSGRIVNREPGAIVLDFAVTPKAWPVDPGRTALYLPDVYGMRLNVWPKAGEPLPEYSIWRDLDEGRFAMKERLRYPSEHMTMQWCTVNDGPNGLYIATEDASVCAKEFHVAYDARRRLLELAVSCPMFLQKGLSFSMPRIVAAPYSGTWHAAARRYRDWWDRQFTIARCPTSAQDMTGMFMVILKQQNGSVTWPYTEFESLGKAALARGISHVEFHGWGKGGHDTLYPEYDPDPEMGGREALMQGIETLKRQGLHVSVYSNGQLQQRGGTRWYETKGRGCPILNRDGTAVSEYWVKFHDVPGKTFDVVCPWSSDWADQMHKICHAARDLGFQGFFYDQIGKQHPWPCFDARHGHRVGENVWTADRAKLWRGVLDDIRREDPDFVLWSEAFNDTLLDSISLFQGLGYVTDAWWGVHRRFAADREIDVYPEMMFYVFPELVMTDRNSTSLCTRTRANGALATNLRIDFEVRYRADREYVESGVPPAAGAYGTVKHKPSEVQLMTAENWAGDVRYLKAVNDFRRANDDLLLRGTFKADEGVKVNGGEKIVANRWDGKNGETGILVWNADDKPVAVEVLFGGKLVSACEPERGYVDGSEPIPPNTLRLYKYRRGTCSEDM